MEYGFKDVGFKKMPLWKYWFPFVMYSWKFSSLGIGEEMEEGSIIK